MRGILPGLEPPEVDEWFLCGPFGMVIDVREVLAAEGVPKKTIHAEVFHVESSPPASYLGRTAPPMPPA